MSTTAAVTEEGKAAEVELRPVKALNAFKVQLLLKKPSLFGLKRTGEGTEEGSASVSECEELLFISLTHRGTFNTFQGDFSKEHLVKLKFNPHDPIQMDFQLIKDAFYGLHSGVTLECGFVSLAEESGSLQSEYFDGAYLALNIKEVYRGHVREYKLLLKPKDASASERQLKASAALREKVDELSAAMATMKAAFEKLEAAKSGRSVTFMERIRKQKARVKGWSVVQWNDGHFGGDSADNCPFAQLSEGSVLITANGDYELCANAAFSYSKAFNMQLVVKGKDGSTRFLDAVGGGYHNLKGSAQTSICRVDSMWLPIEAGSIISMKVFVDYSSACNLCTCGFGTVVLAHFKGAAMPVSSVTIRKLC